MKKILLIIVLIMAIFQMVVLAVAIDIGSEAIDRPNNHDCTNYTFVWLDNPANATGIITSIEIYAYTDLTDCEIATFYVESGNNLTTRDNVTIGSVTSGSKQTLTEDSESNPIALNVQEGDYLGIYCTTGRLEANTSTGNEFWWKASNNIPCNNLLFGYGGSTLVSLYGASGAEEEEANAIFMGTNF